MPWIEISVYVRICGLTEDLHTTNCCSRIRDEKSMKKNIFEGKKKFHLHVDEQILEK